MNESSMPDMVAPQAGNPSGGLEIEKYLADMENLDLSDEQVKLLLETLWTIMASFVEVGFGVDAVQMVLAMHQAALDEDMNNSKGDTAAAFNGAAIENKKGDYKC